MLTKLRYHKYDLQYKLNAKLRGIVTLQWSHSVEGHFTFTVILYRLEIPLVFVDENPMLFDCGKTYLTDIFMKKKSLIIIGNDQTHTFSNI